MSERGGRECDRCLQTGRLLMPVEYDTLFHRYTTHECLSCRLNFDRQGMADYCTLRIEGRHRLPGAISGFRGEHQPREARDE